MSALEILLAATGFVVTALVVAAMILVTPSGGVDVHVEGGEGHGQGADLSPTRAPGRHVEAV